ncbi:G-type lectin S-receptor-like serine/threonine-protein kinase At4g27290 [Rutidosis leptorrhynchoides]|uniref:G-type lectin S-receptor-like serine/threonine-protein kinase At4g27290 n=1 Tax=Rutidosis leptorrhynchoides TaxID=125765 RepID=UPI003A9A2207
MAFREHLFISSALFSFLTNCAAGDTLAIGQEIRDNETIVSAGEMYEMGFFSLGNSKYRYVGIWFKKVSPQTVVWVANRETPVTSVSGVFRVNSNGTLLILNGNNNSLIWSSNYSLSVSNVNIVAKLLDSGNFVVLHENISNISDEDFIWQSFDYPGDTLLAGMKVGKDFVTGRYWSVRSWKSLDDPSPGLYEDRIDTNGYPQYYIRRGSVVEIRFGPWNGVRFCGFPSKTNSLYTYEFVYNQKEVYGNYELINSSVITRLYLSPEGNGMRMNWNPNQGWIPYIGITIDMCTQYGLCSAFGSCNVFNSPACSCMYGFEPRQSDEWKAGNWSSGCQRKEPIKCGNEDSYRKLSGVKLPDTRNSWYNVNMSLVECEEKCKRNCSCTAYANLDIRRGGSGCLLWLDDLMDVRENDENQDIFVRIAKSELSGTKNRLFSTSWVLATIIFMVLVGLALAVYAWKKKRFRNLLKSLSEDNPGGVRNKDAELPFFSFSDISKLTNNFSIDNKLGQGGFGPVYKGVMDNGREIAVKRLSDHSAQGLDEFKNEVRCIHKLQHRNLVKILGFCDEKNEVMLIYEYMPNRSLDTILFDESKSSVLNWSHRLGIINGIARGLLYLHQDSHLRIIHRDLKVANILLDSDMNPKISDFGFARIFEGCETGANTKNVVGTYGYIPPEYALHGVFSIRSDVFSFGVLVLEIISRKKNQLIFSQQRTDNLLGHAWRLFKDDSEVLRSIHIGLLCVQPKPPAFFTEADLNPRTSSTTTTMSANDMTVSLTGR